jgi:hypothetical protein
MSGTRKLSVGILVVSVLLGLVQALVFAVSPFSVLEEAELGVGRVPVLPRLWGVTWVAFSILVLAVTLISYRKGERWAWYSLWLVPTMSLLYFVLVPDLLQNLVQAVISVVGLLIGYRRFFPVLGSKGVA